jgi:hypothetical protein
LFLKELKEEKDNNKKKENTAAFIEKTKLAL